MKIQLASVLGAMLVLGTVARAADNSNAQAAADPSAPAAQAVQAADYQSPQAADRPNAQAAPATANTRVDDDSARPGSDGWITTKVKAQLLTTKDVPSTQISVTTNNRVVTLSGVLDTKAQVKKSIEVAKAVEGVDLVDSSALTSRN